MAKDDKKIEKISFKDHEFLDESRKAFLVESPRWSNALLYGMVAFLLIAIIWANFAEIDEVTHGEGKVIPSSQVQIIQNLEGGILSEIFVREGDTVQKGQVLLRIDDTRFASSFREGRSKYLSMLASVARLKAEEEGKDTIDYPEIVKKEAPEVITRENNLFRQRREQLLANTSTLERSYELAQEELDITKPLVEEGLMS